MTTPTTNMNWSDPIVGADSDTWGDKTNAIWDNLDAHAVGLIYGLTLSAAGSTATFGVAAGAASGMLLSSAYTKTTSAWGVGTGQGALDTGAIANSTWYHVWLIQRTDTGVVDILVSTSASSPTMPTNYTRKRRIGTMLTDGSAQWVKFSQNGDQFLWDVRVLSANGLTPANSSAFNLSLSVPPGVKVSALFTISYTYSANGIFYLLTSPDQADTQPSGSVYTGLVSASSTTNSQQINLRTNTSGQVRMRAITSGGGAPDGTYSAFTHGWIDRRGQDA